MSTNVHIAINVTVNDSDYAYHDPQGNTELKFTLPLTAAGHMNYKEVVTESILAAADDFKAALLAELNEEKEKAEEAQ